LIECTTPIHQKVDDGVVVKSLHVERKAVEFVFETAEELACCTIFGKTTMFSKQCQRPMVGESKYLQHLDIINVVIPLPVQEIQNGKCQGIVI